MSKGNMLLGHARGKVGDLVFSRVNGQQVTRARAAVVKNPQTEKQIIQRILLNTIIQAYSRMSEICDHSFEGVPTGMASMNKFMKENMNALRSKVASEYAESGTFEGIYAFAPKGVNMFTPNEYIISTGVLPRVTLASVSATNGAAIAIAAAGATPTYAEILTALGLQRGDQLTFIGQELYTDGRAAFKFARVILDPRESDGTQADLSTPFLANGAVNKPSPRNEGSDIALSYATGNLIFNLGENSQYGAAVVVSRQKADGTWLRSNTVLELAESLPYTLVGAFDMQEAIDYSMSGGIDLESERYLNNAVRGTKIVAPNPSPAADPVLTSLEEPTTETSVLAASVQTALESGQQLTFVGTDLRGSYLVLTTTNKNVGDSVDVSSLAANKKFAITANSGETTSLVWGTSYERLYLVKNDVIMQKCGQVKMNQD